jgi:glycosyltransferase involved in cell wall biosynthesis
MQQPLISIVLPTYNGSKYLATSVQSCLDQTWQNWELIIINDCSTDSTLAIAESFVARDSRIRVISNEKNLKLPMSLNRGFSEARGELFTWTSDDNYYAPQALETLANALLQQADAALVYADETLIDDDGNSTGTWVMGDVNQSVTAWKGCGGCFLYRRDMQTLLKGYDPSMFMIEDYDFFLRGFVQCKYLYINRADLYYYRFHPASLTGRYMPYVSDLQKLVIEKQLDALEPKINQQDFALLLRKLAVYYMTHKAHAGKFQLYMGRLRKVSMAQWLITLVYVPVKGLLNFGRQLWASFKVLLTQLWKA